MFEDEDAFGSKDVLLEYEVGYLWQFLQRVGRVGKDKVKLLSARFDEAEYITTYRCTHVGAEFLKAL